MSARIADLLKKAKTIRSVDVGPKDVRLAAALVAEAQRVFDAAALARFHEQHPGELPRRKIKGVWYYVDDRLQEYRRIDNPHERITFDEIK